MTSCATTRTPQQELVYHVIQQCHDEGRWSDYFGDVKVEPDGTWRIAYKKTPPPEAARWHTAMIRDCVNQKVFIWWQNELR